MQEMIAPQAKAGHYRQSRALTMTLTRSNPIAQNGAWSVEIVPNDGEQHASLALRELHDQLGRGPHRDEQPWVESQVRVILNM